MDQKLNSQIMLWTGSPFLKYIVETRVRESSPPFHNRNTPFARISRQQQATPRSASSSSPSSNSRRKACPEPSGIFPHPEDCTKFLNCAHGRAFEQNCPAGLHFNAAISNCDWPNSANCKPAGKGGSRGSSNADEYNNAVSASMQAAKVILTWPWFWFELI